VADTRRQSILDAGTVEHARRKALQSRHPSYIDDLISLASKLSLLHIVWIRSDPIDTRQYVPHLLRGHMIPESARTGTWDYHATANVLSRYRRWVLEVELLVE
jgi:hypothetical protein